MKHTCETCGKEFSQKGHLDTHKSKKRPCKASPTLEALIEKKVHEILKQMCSGEAKIEPPENTIVDTQPRQMDVSKKTLAELKALCKERSLKGITGKSKAELVAMLGASQPQTQPQTQTQRNALSLFSGAGGDT